MQTITIQGPFSDDEIARIIAVVGDIESTRPEETFEIFFNYDNIDRDGFVELLERVNPLRPGYERQILSIETTDSRG